MRISYCVANRVKNRIENLGGGRGGYAGRLREGGLRLLRPVGAGALGACGFSLRR
jgi:hypothetical protein